MRARAEAPGEHLVDAGYVDAGLLVRSLEGIVCG